MNELSGGRGHVVSALAVALSIAVGACADDPAGPLELDGQTGTVEGLLFFDADRDARFDPAAGDFALEGVDVLVRERGTEQVFSGGTTGPEGRFSVSGVPTGTHDLFIDTTTVTEDVDFCQNPVQVSVFIDETRFREVDARTGCVITIAEAEEQSLGEFVTVRGVVTSFPGQLRSSYTHIEDATGAIRIFSSVPEGQGIEIGDRIEVSGTLDAFNDDLQLSGSVTVNDIEKDFAEPTPELLTTGEIAAAGSPPDNPLLGSFVRVEGAELETGFVSGGDRNANVDDGTGSTEIRIETGVSSGTGDDILTEGGLTVGACYDITGVLGTFLGTAQLFPRSFDDFEEVPCD